jgi:hypothetical protein
VARRRSALRRRGDDRIADAHGDNVAEGGDGNVIRLEVRAASRAAGPATTRSSRSPAITC